MTITASEPGGLNFSEYKIFLAETLKTNYLPYGRSISTHSGVYFTVCVLVRRSPEINRYYILTPEGMGWF